MKKKLIVLLSAAMGVAVISLAADLSGGKPQTDHEAVQELRTQIVELRAKIQALEAQTRNLETTVAQLKPSHSPTPLNLVVPPASQFSPPATTPQPPKIWGQREVNGWTYYIVPCEQERR